ncbi:MAG: hypothetical protein ACJAVM_003225 [Sulfitobacter sp.]|jgi:hypothetical protein
MRLIKRVVTHPAAVAASNPRIAQTTVNIHVRVTPNITTSRRCHAAQKGG